MAEKFNLYCDQGTFFTTDLQLTDGVNAANTVGYTTVNSYFKYSITQNTYSGQITTSLDTNSSILTLTIAANQTANIAIGRYFYDILLLDPSGNPDKVAEGILTINPCISGAISIGSESEPTI